MASFDMITAVGNAYQTTWRERRYLLRMALIPLLIKYICDIVSLLYVGDDNILRTSFVRLPAYFAEGWFLAHWARTIVLGHRWPFKPSGDNASDLALLRERGRGILSATIGFVLINFLIFGYLSFFIPYIPLDMDTSEPDPSVAIIGMFMIATSFLAFRFVWLYIPLALNISMSSYIKKMKSIPITFPMLGIWLVCTIPSVLALQFIGGALQSFGGEGNENSLITGVIIFARMALDMIKNILVTAGMAYAFMELFKFPKNEEDNA